MMSNNKVGKIEHSLLEQCIYHQCGYHRKEVKAGPQFGVDVSLITLSADMEMACTSDPLSLIPSLGLQESAWLSVHLMANDMATTGYAPMYGQFVLNLPSSFSKNDFAVYWEHIHTYCSRIGVAITGGHTGFVEGQHSTIAGGGTFTAVAPTGKMLLSKYARSGDAILITKTSALSASAILAMSFPGTVKNKAGTEIYRLGCESFYDTSSLKDALTAFGKNGEHAGITAMHDVTEGGVLGAIYELAVASGNGARVFNDKLPIAPVQAEICRIFSVDPRRCIGAGAMIITCKAEAVNAVMARLRSENIPCAQVGELCPPLKGIKLVDKNGAADMVYQEQDPYWAAFFNALKAGWK